MTNREIKNKLQDMKKGARRFRLVHLWNEFCEENGDTALVFENILEDMEGFFYSIANFYNSLGDYQDCDDFFSFEEGIINSFDSVDSIYCPIDIDVLATWLENNKDRWEELGFSLN